MTDNKNKTEETDSSGSGSTPCEVDCYMERLQIQVNKSWHHPHLEGGGTDSMNFRTKDIDKAMKLYDKWSKSDQSGCTCTTIRFISASI